MGGALLPIIPVAAAIALLASLALFRTPAWARVVFFQPNGTWRRFGQAAWFVAIAVLVLVGLLVTPSGA